MDNFNIKKYLNEGRLLKEIGKKSKLQLFEDEFTTNSPTLKNKYIIKYKEGEDELYMIDNQKALDYLKQFNSSKINANAFFKDNEGWVEFVNNSLEGVENMTDKELETAMRTDMIGYYSSQPDKI